MFVIIPVKPFNLAKTRLASILLPQQRADLSRYLLRRTICLAHQVGEVVVISTDSEVRQLAKQAGAWALVEAGQGLNAALQQASEWAMAHGSQTTLILPADLPLLSSSDLSNLVALGQQSVAVVIAPCHRQDGTNALLLRPPNLIDFNFGVSSYHKHQQAAEMAGVESLIYQSATIALDLDYPDDLVQYKLSKAGQKPEFLSQLLKK